MAKKKVTKTAQKKAAKKVVKKAKKVAKKTPAKSSTKAIKPGKKKAAKKQSKPAVTQSAGKTAAKKKTAKKSGRPKANFDASTSSGSKKQAVSKSSKSVKNPQNSQSVSVPPPNEELDELGQPRLSADTYLDRIFENDASARRALEFLQVFTLRELEQLDPDELITRLSSPTIQTVGRIRKRLAILNRSLKGDAKFARDFQARMRKEAGKKST